MRARKIEEGDVVALAYMTTRGHRLESETFVLVRPGVDAPSNALNPDCLVGRLLLDGHGVGDRVRYEGEPNRLGHRQSFEFEILAVERQTVSRQAGSDVDTAA